MSLPYAEVLTAGLLLGGALLVLIASVGLLRMPDVFTRMHVTSKAATLGVCLLALAVAVHFADFGLKVRALLIAAFYFLTAPVASHMLGRAAYLSGVPLAAATVADDLKDKYGPESHALAGCASSEITREN
jgi:multicomponent Na+:H+ antiporter subunit G